MAGRRSPSLDPLTKAKDGFSFLVALDTESILAAARLRHDHHHLSPSITKMVHVRRRRRRVVVLGRRRRRRRLPSLLLVASSCVYYLPTYVRGRERVRGER